MKKKAIVILAASALLLSLAACSSDNTDIFSGSDAENKYTLNAVNEEAEISADYGGGVAEYDRAETAVPSAVNGSSPEVIRKIIKNAFLDIEANDASALYANLNAYCAELGGYEFSNETQNFESYSVISATLKIPPEKLDEFLKYAGENGNIINSRVNSDDITEAYFDLKIRLETKRAALAQYYKLLQSAHNVDEIITLQRTIDSITEEIEAAEGKLRLYDSLVDMATVSLYIRQENDPVKIRKEIEWSSLTLDDMGYLIRRGVVGVANAIVTVFQWLLIVVTVTAPLWIPAGVIVVIAVRAGKKKRAKKAQVLQSPPVEAVNEEAKPTNPESDSESSGKK